MSRTKNEYSKNEIYDLKQQCDIKAIDGSHLKRVEELK